MSTAIQKFRAWLVSPTDGQVIGLFRLIFGLFMVYYTAYLNRIGFISEGLLKPKVLFKFDYLGWVQPFSGPVMNGLLLLMGFSALAIALGFMFRWACWIFSLCLAFFLFQEKSYYNNHIYLFMLLPLLLSATDADRYFSVRSKNRPFEFVPRWQQFILQAQIMAVYFFAGVVKLKGDWLLRQEPMSSLIHQMPADHFMAPLIKHDFNIGLFTYGGFLLDILAPFLLWYKPVRNWAWIPFALFHLTNSQVFDDISIFPFVMLGAIILFFDTSEIPLLKDYAVKPGATAPEKGSKAKKTEVKLLALMPATKNITAVLLLGYFAFQVLFPLRGFFLPNPLDYTTIGNRFAWRVKNDTRNPEEMAFAIINPTTQQSLNVEIPTFLNPSQIRTLALDPRAVRDFALALKEEAVLQGIPNAVVKARIRFGYNGRAPQFFVDPEVDLTTVPYSPFKRLDWVVPVSN
ncbi:MAG: HTTM domain-containing protein [Saprospiraceae bacterium]|nr:HTTM domain-containing protein [Saprospiraceae bacterium]